MLPAAQITHQMQGRVRIRIPERRRNEEYFAHLKESLSRCDGVDVVATNPLAASVLVTGTATGADLIAFAERSQLFAIAKSEREVRPLTEGVAAQMGRLDGRVRAATAGHFDLNSAGMVGLVAAFLWQLSRRRVLPEALNILWYALALIPRRDGNVPRPT